MRIWSPNLAYCPQTTRSALLKSATRRIVAGSSTVAEEIRRSVNIWCTLLGLTVRNCADWPTSVLNMSARLGPIQSRLGSPDALRKGKIASDTVGLAGANPVLGDDLKSRSRSMYPLIARTKAVTIPAMSGHGRVCPHGLTLASKLIVPAALLSFHVFRSARMAEALWYLWSKSRSRHLPTIPLNAPGI